MIGPRDCTVGDFTETTSIKHKLRRYEERDISPFSLLGQREETTLAQTCIRLLASNFEETPIPSELLPSDQYKLLCDQLEAYLNPTIAVQFVEDEDFWKVFPFFSLVFSFIRVCFDVSSFFWLFLILKSKEGMLWVSAFCHRGWRGDDRECH